MRNFAFYIMLLFSVVLISAQCPPENYKEAQELWTHGEGHLAHGSPESQKNLDRAIGICPSYAMAWRERGVPYLKRGDFAEWARNINKAVELDPLGFLPIRGWCRFDFLRDYEGAIADLSRLDTLVQFHTIYASDFNIYIILGEAHVALGNNHLALTYYEKAIANTIKERGEDWVGLYDYLYRGILKMKMGDKEGALKDFDNEITMYSTLADPYYWKGRIYLELGMNAEAKGQLATALELINGKGIKHKDPYAEVQNEIYVSDVQEAISKLK